MYTQVGALSLSQLGTKAVSFADQLAAGAQRVSGAIRGAAVGAKTAPAHPYLMPVLIGLSVFLALQLFSAKKRKGT